MNCITAEGNTLEEMRKNARTHLLAEQDARKLVWVKEDDLCSSGELDKTPEPSPGLIRIFFEILVILVGGVIAFLGSSFAGFILIGPVS
ncbi:hypothetical protein ACQU0X_25700 [Pseudovibrio ascidiaceicola]|uniref:hypothetical protein n=1 Tax=Pseudovibrio ascidiaceicola TaxID=285279 RepID=UPI003D36B167